MRNKLFVIISFLFGFLNSNGASVFEVNGVNYQLNILDGVQEAIVISGDYSGVVIVPESVVYDNKEIPVVAVADNAFKDSDRLIGVTLPSTIKTIGESAFEGCSKLAAISLGDGAEIIGKSCFAKCYSLTSLSIPESIVSIGNGAFRSCIKLVDISLPSTLNSISQDMLYGCASLKNIKLPSALKYVYSNALDSCVSLNEINLPSTIIEFPNGFPKSINLSKISIENGSEIFSVEDNTLYKINKDTSLSLWFCPTNKPEGLTISDKVTCIIGATMIGYVNTPKITIPKSVTELGTFPFGNNPYVYEIELHAAVEGLPDKMFYNWTNLKKVGIDSDLKRLGKQAFYGCRNLQEITLPQTLNDISEECFSNCASLSYISLPDNLKTIGSNSFYNCAHLKSVRIPESTESIGGGAFSKCIQLEEIIIPERVEEINSALFAYCSELRDIKIKASSPILYYGAFMYTAIESIDLPSNTQKFDQYLFEGCKYLKEIKIPDNIIQIPQHCFAQCTSLQKVEFGTNIKQIDEYAFYKCQSLEEIDLSTTTANVNKFVFDGCSSLKKIILPNNLSSINDYLFRDCINLKEIELPKNLMVIGKYAFSNTGLEKIVFPSLLMQIGESAFERCDSLKSVVINSILTEIPRNAFRNCSSLSSFSIEDGKEGLILPESITKVDEYAFNNTGFSTILFPKNLTEFTSTSFAESKQLKNVVLSDLITEIPASAFINCPLLSNVCTYSTIDYSEGFNIPSTITNIGDRAFSNCGFKSIVIPDHIQELGYCVFSNCKNLQELILHENFKGDKAQKNDGYNGLTHFSEGAFYGCPNLVLVKSYSQEQPSMYFALNNIQVFPAALIPKGTRRNYQMWFQGEDVFYNGVVIECGDIDNYNYFYDGEFVYHILENARVEIIKGTYSANGPVCLKSTAKHNDIEYRVVGIGDYALSNCWVSRSNLPEYLEYTGEYIFSNEARIIGDLPKTLKRFHLQGCRFEDDIHIPEGTDSIQSGAFSITTFNPTVFEKGVYLNKELRYIGGGAFEFAELTSINIGMAPLDQTNKRVFNYTPNLQYLEVDPDNEYLCSIDGVLYDKEIKTVLFYPEGKKQSNYTIPIGVESILCDFKEVKNLCIPMSVNSIDYSSEFETVHCNASTPPVFTQNKQFIYETYHSYKGNTLYVPRGCKDAYETATGWDFKTIIEEDIEIPTFTITYIVGEMIYQQVTVEYNSIITTIEGPDNLPENINFLGWEETPERMPAHDITVRAILSEEAGIISPIDDEESFDVYGIDGTIKLKKVSMTEFKSLLGKGLYILKSGKSTKKYVLE